MASSLRTLVAKIIKIGSLTVRGPLGEETFGRGGGRNVTIRFTDAKAEEELAADPALKLGELYMEGRLLIDEGDIYEFLALVKDNTLSEGLTFGTVWRGLLRIGASLFRNRVCRSTTTDAMSPIITISTGGCSRSVSRSGLAIFLRLFQPARHFAR